MRILHVINSANPRGGGPIEAILQAVRELGPRGHQNEILCVDSPHSPWLQKLDCPSHAVGPAKSAYRYTPRVRGWLAENLGRYEAAIVHSLWQHPGHELSAAAKAAAIPYLVYTHGALDPAHKRVFWMKHPQKRAMWLLRERRFLEDADAVLFTCDEERDLALKSFWPGLTGRNAAVVPYCTGEPPTNVDSQRAAFRALYPQLAARPFLLFLSRLHPKKGPELLLSAFSEVKDLLADYVLVMAGPGADAYVSKLKKMTGSLGIDDRVLWPGMLSGDLKWGAFRSADAFALCTHQENFGIAVVEALACSLPVMTTDRVNIWKTIANSTAGIIGADSVESCTGMLKRWARMTPEERNEMRHNARLCFEANYSAAQAADTLLSVLCRAGKRKS